MKEIQYEIIKAVSYMTVRELRELLEMLKEELEKKEKTSELLDRMKKYLR